MTKEPPDDDLTTPEGERSVLPQAETGGEADPRAGVPKELALREREVLPEVVRGVEMMLAEAMYPERVLRFPDESVGVVRWCALGGNWEESPEGSASAQGEVRIPAGRRALLELGVVRNADFLLVLRQGALQGLWDHNFPFPSSTKTMVITLIGRGFGRWLEELSFQWRFEGDVSPLQDLTNLQVLSLAFTRVSDVRPLQGLTNLQTLDLRCTRVSDVRPLQGLTNLQVLRLAVSRVSDVRPLQGLTNLRTLYLDRTRVSDVSALQGLTNLQNLGLRGTRVSDVSPLQGLTNLQTLDLGITRVSDLSPLKGLTNLQTLDLRGTQVSDLSPLQGLTNLQALDLNDTQVSDVSPLRHLTNLRIRR